MTAIIRSLVRVATAIILVSHFGSAIVAAQTGADLVLEKSTFDNPAAADSTLTYTIFLFNDGPENAQNVVLTDVMPADVMFESVTPFPDTVSCLFDAPSRTLTCDLGEVVAFDAVFLELTVRTPAYPTTIVNTATVTTSTSDPNLVNNSSTASTEVVRFNLSDLGVTMTASADTVRVHQAVTFTTTVTNFGPQGAAGVALSLSPPFLADIVSVTSSQGTCTTTADTIDCLLGPMFSGATATVSLEVKPQKDGFALTFASVSGYDDPLFRDPEFLNDFAFLSVDVNYPGNADPSFSNTTSQLVPYENVIFNPCANDVIYLSGMLRQVVSLTQNNNRFRTNIHTNFQGITAIGLGSGTEYRVTGNSRSGSGLSLVFNGLFPKEVTAVDNVNLRPAGGGGGDRLRLHQNTHFTINANGTFTAVVDNPRLECK